MTFKNPKTGELKQVKVGWSWVLSLLSGFFGIPLFMRKLYAWGAIFLVFRAASIIVLPLALYLFPIEIIFDIWLGIKGNEMTAKNYLERGWVFADPDSDAVRFAKVQWGMSSLTVTNQATN